MSMGSQRFGPDHLLNTHTHSCHMQREKESDLAAYWGNRQGFVGESLFSLGTLGPRPVPRVVGWM